VDSAAVYSLQVKNTQHESEAGQGNIGEITQWNLKRVELSLYLIRHNAMKTSRAVDV
jgi:hypothetical protein